MPPYEDLFLTVFQVIWSNGQTTWVKSSDLPRQFKGNSTNIKVDYIPKNVFGQKNIVQRLTVTGENNHLEENYQQLQKYVHSY